MISAEPTIPSKELVLPRFLAVILFGLAAFIGLPTVAATVGSIFAGKWNTVLVMAMVVPVVWAPVWVGRRIWSGRSIPMWFVYAMGGLMAVVPTLGLLIKGEWLGALCAVGFFAPFLMIAWSGMQTSYEKPAKPKELDDLA